MPFKGSCALFPELQRDKDTVQVYPARHRTPPLRITDANLDCAFVENSLLSIDSKIGEGRPPPATYLRSKLKMCFLLFGSQATATGAMGQ